MHARIREGVGGWPVERVIFSTIPAEALAEAGSGSGSGSGYGSGYGSGSGSGSGSVRKLW